MWEIRIKAAKGKLRLGFSDVIAEARLHRFDLLSISASHARTAADLPLHHKDPFDRMLVAQAQLEGFTILNGDRAFSAYGVPVLWA